MTETRPVVTASLGEERTQKNVGRTKEAQGNDQDECYCRFQNGFAAVSPNSPTRLEISGYCQQQRGKRGRVNLILFLPTWIDIKAL